jgi:cytochrome c oxidase subunit 2
MMFRRLVLLVLSVSVAALATVVARVPDPPAPTAVVQAQEKPPVVKEIEVRAKKYEFTPNKIEVALNTVVRLKITADDTTHGFELEGVKDSCIHFEKGKPTTVEFQAVKAGTFKFKCCKFCGLGHGRMNGTIVVK